MIDGARERQRPRSTGCATWSRTDARGRTVDWPSSAAIPTPDIFDSLSDPARGKGGEIQLTDGMHSSRDAAPVYGYRFEGTRYDAGNKLGFLKATVEFALKRHDLGGQFRAYLKTLSL